MVDSAFEYWEQIEEKRRVAKENDPQALALAKAIKRALPDAFIFKIIDDSYMGSYGWAQLFISAAGVLVREWGGFHKPDRIDDIVAATIKADAYWIEQYGKTMSYESHRESKIKDAMFEVTTDD